MREPEITGDDQFNAAHAAQARDRQSQRAGVGDALRPEHDSGSGRKSGDNGHGVGQPDRVRKQP